MENKIIYALGFFDGVHLGHQALLTACRELADKHDCQAGAVTFTAHPNTFVSGSAPALITTSEERKQLLFCYGMDFVAELPFDKQVMTTHWSEFLNQLVAGGAVGFVCGDDFRFGAGGSGTAKKLEAFCKKRQLPYAIVPEQILGGKRISSTQIRELLEAGRAEEAAELLGRPHTLTGKVQAGHQLGRTMDFATANLAIPAGVVIPKLGVYACKVAVDGNLYTAVTNIGTRPTVGGEGITAEAHLLDFEGDLYGEEITVAFCQFLRPEKKFDSLAQLKEQIAQDILKTREML